MTQYTTVHSALSDSTLCGVDIGGKIRASFDGAPPDAVIVFASSRHHYEELLNAIRETCTPAIMVGCSSAGEFITRAYSEGSVSALAIRSSEIVFNAVVGRELRKDRAATAKSMTAAFKGIETTEYPFRAALVLTDALAGHADDFVEQLTVLTAGKYQLFGGGAGDDANFTRTHVFLGTEAVPDAAIALEILSQKPIGVGVRHTWTPASAPMRVTEADGMRLIGINNTAPTAIFEAHAAATNQTFDPKNPLPFFLHNVIGIDTPAGYRLRVPLAFGEDGSLSCAADIPTGSVIHIMAPKGGSAIEATRSAKEQLEGYEPGAALFFDCVATRLRMGRDFGIELEGVREALGATSYAGCNTYGQIARGNGQFNGFHNCTAVVALFPK